MNYITFTFLGELFGVNTTTVHRCIKMFTDAMTKKKEEIIYLPDDAEAAAIADRFEQKYAYPQAFAAIDGTHIPVTPPSDGYRDFINRKMYPSVIFQAVCDDKYLFRDIFAKLPGCCHDAHVFSRSPLFDYMHSLPRRDRVIDGTTVPLHMLGDPAYPLFTGLLKSYTGRNFSPECESYNVYLSSVRMAIEIAFGRLKAR